MSQGACISRSGCPLQLGDPDGIRIHLGAANGIYSTVYLDGDASDEELTRTFQAALRTVREAQADCQVP